jgi:hypothetical protein
MVLGLLLLPLGSKDSTQHPVLKYYVLLLISGNKFHTHVKQQVKLKFWILVGKPEGKGPLGRPRRRWVDNIRMDLREIGGDDVDWIHLAQDRDRWRALVNTVMNLRVP